MIDAISGTDLGGLPPPPTVPPVPPTITTTVTPPPPEVPPKSTPPWFMPDTQGFLAIAILVIMGAVVWLLLTRPIQIDERTSGVLMTILGVLTACLKDVYSFFFGSSRGSAAKDDVLLKQAQATVTTVTK